MIDPSKYDRILAYGCSWTAGDELMDHKILGITFSECNKLKKEYKNAGVFNDTFGIVESNYENRNAAWPSQLSRLMNKTFESRARSGSSMDHIYYDLYTDIINNYITDRDLVLVGLTSPNRFFSFNKNQPKTLLFGYAPHWEDDNVLKMFTSVCEDNFIVFNYFKTVAALNALKSRINLKIQPTSGGMSPNSEGFETYNISHITRKYALDVWNNSDTILLAEDFLKMEPENLELCGFRHQPIESHIALAKRIYNRCVLK